ncbi:hypothetical protein C0431_15595 [bacterium]|nr:hypothetical protein [bacterium]
MKTPILTAIAVFAIIPITANASYQANSSPLQSVKQREAAKTEAWNDCADFIFQNSTSISPDAMTRLHQDVMSGVVTWSISSSVQILALDGPSVGWVDGEEIEFASQADLDTAVALILNATATKPN